LYLLKHFGKLFQGCFLLISTKMPEAPQTPQPQLEAQKKNTGMAIVAYILFFIPLLIDSKNDPFVKYHVKQGFGLFICGLALSVLRWILSWFLDWIIDLASLGIFILFIIGIINASSGEEKPLPLIGKLANELKIV
jgi:uncharacterized membrane protein